MVSEIAEGERESRRSITSMVKILYYIVNTLTDQMVVSDAERLYEGGQLRRLDVRVLDDQPVHVPDQHERLREPSEVGNLLGPPVRGRDDVYRVGRGGRGPVVAARAVHHVPGDLPRDARQQVLGHVHVLIQDHLGQRHRHQVLGHRVRAAAGQRLALLLRPRARRLVLHEHHEHGAHGQRPQQAHLYGHWQNHD